MDIANKASGLSKDAGRPPVSRLAHLLRPAALGVFALALVVSAIVVAAGTLTERSYWARIIAWRDARFDDFATKFPARPIANGPAAYRFGPPPAPMPLGEVTHDGRSEPLATLLAASGTTAFLVLHGNQLLVESYFNGADHGSTQTSFS